MPVEKEQDERLNFDPGIPRHVYAGNDEADAMAKLAAASHEVPEATAKQQQELEQMAFEVSQRIAVLALEAVR